MHRQKSFENEKPTLYLVPTPIGNLDEMTPRAIDVLKAVDVIACEDTRTSGTLLKRFDISKRLIAYENFNEDRAYKGILNLLSQGKNVAIISDAGYPLINDPGQRIVTEACACGYNVVPLSGCNAMLNGLVASGLIVQPFIFVGFLPPSKNDCIKKLNEYKNYPMTLVFYEAPHRIEKMMNNVYDVFGNRQCCIARELTKLHEEFIRGTIEEVIPVLPGLKGEMVVIVEGNKEEPGKAIDMSEIISMVNEQIELGLTKSDAIKAVAKEAGVSKNEIYNVYHNKVN